MPRSPKGRKKQLRQAKPVLPPKPLILCIEDKPSQLQMRTAVLEGEGYEVVGVADGRLALREFQGKPAEFLAIIRDLVRRSCGLVRVAGH